MNYGILLTVIDMIKSIEKLTIKIKSIMIVAAPMIVEAAVQISIIIFLKRKIIAAKK